MELHDRLEYVWTSVVLAYPLFTLASVFMWWSLCKNLFLVCVPKTYLRVRQPICCASLLCFQFQKRKKKLMNTLHAWGLSDIIRVMINSVNMNFVSFSLTLLLSYLLTYFRTRTVSLDINNKFSLSLFSYASFHVTDYLVLCSFMHSVGAVSHFTSPKLLVNLRWFIIMIFWWLLQG